MSSTDLRFEIGVKLFQIALPIIILIGVLLNPICFYIYSKKAFSKSTTGFYLQVLSITDLLAILPATFYFMIYAFDINLMLVDSCSCKLIVFFLYAPQAVSAWFEALVSIDRAFSIAFPSRFTFREKRKFQLSLTAFIILYNYIYYCPILVFFHKEDFSDSGYMNQTANMTTMGYVDPTASASCDSDETYYTTLSWMDLISSTILPFSTMIVSTIVINNHLAKSRKKVIMKASDSRTRTESFSIDTNNKTYDSAKPEKHSHRLSRIREQKDRSFAITSIAINVVFFILNIGIVLLNLLSPYNILDSEQYMLFNAISSCLFYTDFVVKFFIYLVANTKFRNEFFVLTKSFAGCLKF